MKFIKFKPTVRSKIDETIDCNKIPRKAFLVRLSGFFLGVFSLIKLCNKPLGTHKKIGSSNSLIKVKRDPRSVTHGEN